MNSESEKDEFLRVSEEVASCFLDLYLDEGEAKLSFAARSPAQQRANADPTHPAPASPVAAEVNSRSQEGWRHCGLPSYRLPSV